MVEEKKEAILISAENLFATKGFEKITIANIAEDSGINEASIYSYYGNKRNILFAIYGKYIEFAVHDLKEHFQGLPGAHSKTMKLIWHFLHRIKKNPNYAKLLLFGQRGHPDFYASEYSRQLKKNLSIAFNLAIQGQEEGLFRSDISPHLISNLTVGTVQFTIYNSIVHNRPYDPDEMSNIIYRLVINAVSPDNKKSLQKNRIELRKQQILDAAVRIFSKKSFSSATISEIAEEAKLSYATIYEYFENKDAILFSIPARFQQELLTEEIAHLKGNTSEEKTMRKLIWQYVSQLWIHEDFSRILTLDLYRNMKYYKSPGYQYLKAYMEKIRKVFHQGQKKDIFIKDIPFFIYWHMIIGTIDQFLLSKFLQDSPPLRLAELNDIVDAFIRAIKVQENS